MSATGIPPGWHPDPANPAGSLRWWDGQQWTSHVQAVPSPPDWSGGPNAASGSPFANQWSASASQSFGARNRASLTAAGVAALYVVIAVTAHIVLLGIFPILLSVRAVRRREPLAPLAVAAAAVALIIGIGALALR